MTIGRARKRMVSWLPFHNMSVLAGGWVGGWWLAREEWKLRLAQPPNKLELELGLILAKTIMTTGANSMHYPYAALSVVKM